MNLANKITTARIFMIPVFIYFLTAGTDMAMLIAGVIFIVASLTDAVDGYIARSRNMVTKLGKFLDPLADKLLVLSAFMVFVEIQVVPSWIVIIIVSRELIVSVFRAIAASEGVVIAASILGKYKTISQMITIIVLCFYPFIDSYIPFKLDDILVYICTGLTLLSGIDYLIKNRAVLNEKA